MSNIIEYLELKYYAPAAFLVLCCITAYISFQKARRLPYLNLLRFYILSALIQTVATLLCITFLDDWNLACAISNFTVYIFSIIELIFVNAIIFQTIRTQILKIIMAILFLLFVALLIYIVIKVVAVEFYMDIPTLFSLFNLVCIIVPCLFYLYEIFEYPPLTNLPDEPTFWIVAGFLFMAVCILPFYLLENYIHQNMPTLYNQIYVLNEVFYCFLYILISKALLCNPIIK